MANVGHRHHRSRRSRVVGVLKLVLPLMALILLGLVVLWEEPEEPGIGLVFSDTDLEALKSGMRLTGPQLSGASLTGDLYDFRAETVVPTDRELSGLELDQLTGEIAFLNARTVSLTSDAALVDLTTQTIQLTTGIGIRTSDGYQAQATEVLVDTRAGSVLATGDVTAAGPLGMISAASLWLSPAPADDGGSRNDALIRFEGGVTLRYTPGMENQ